MNGDRSSSSHHADILDSYCPKMPVSSEKTGLTEYQIIRFITKCISVHDVMTPGQISKVLALPAGIVVLHLEEMTSLRLIESRGLETGAGRQEIRYSLTTKGKSTATEAFAESRYFGPAPVPLADFISQVKKQAIRRENVSAARLNECTSHLVLPPGIESQLGPAVNSARSVLLYGQPGNGKTSIAEAMGKCFLDIVYFPHAICIGTQIIQFFDEASHVRSERPEKDSHVRADRRWVPCRRPVITTGGELTLKMLDLIYNPQANFYEAPVHLKALGGVFVIDDFGRQQVSPQELINRWIVPLERGHDFLTLHTGKKFEVPFDQLVIFSTNLMPDEVSDGAGLRRIYFKIEVPSPTRDEYIEIFRRMCRLHGVAMKEQIIGTFFDEKYTSGKLVTSGAHPGFILNHVLAVSRFQESEVDMTRELLELVWKNVATNRIQST